MICLAGETADGQGIVTDLMLNPKLKETDWLTGNAEWEPNGTKISTVCENKHTGSDYWLVESGKFLLYHYYTCDSQYNIAEELQKEFIDTYYEDTRVPLTYQITADGL